MSEDLSEEKSPNPFEKYRLRGALRAMGLLALAMLGLVLARDIGLLLTSLAGLDWSNSAMMAVGLPVVALVYYGIRTVWRRRSSDE